MIRQSRTACQAPNEGIKKINSLPRPCWYKYAKGGWGKRESPCAFKGNKDRKDQLPRAVIGCAIEASARRGRIPVCKLYAAESAACRNMIARKGKKIIVLEATSTRTIL